MRRLRGYTLVEMSVALTIVLVLAAMLAPVFIQVKEEAKRAACSMNFRQVHLALTLYQVDYEDRFAVAKYRVGRFANASTDRTWIQLVQPYLRSFESTKCPSDSSRRPGEDLVFNADLAMGDYTTRYYTLSSHANTGFNFIYLSPVVRESNGQWVSRPRSGSDVQDPSKTLLLGDSAWDVGADGRPIEGGSFLIVPPCRYVAQDQSDSFGLPTYGNEQIFMSTEAWDDTRPPQKTRYGGVWPWHFGHATTVMADGSVKSLTLSQISSGCRVRPNWGGQITDLGQYIWDLR